MPSTLPPPRRPRGRAAAVAVLAAVTLSLAATPATAAPAPGTPDPYELLVKLRDDTTVTATGDRLELASSAAQQRLDRLVGPARTTGVEPAIPASPERLDAERRRALRAGKDVNDLTTWFHIKLEREEDPAKILAALRADPLVEHADPVTAPAPPPATDLRPFQQPLFGSGPAGMGIAEARNLPGGRGDRVNIAIGEGRPAAHEDLPDLISTAYGNPLGSQVQSHATATVGVIAGRTDNAIGVDGIAPDARARLAFWDAPATLTDWLESLTRASLDMGPGDVLLLEAQDGVTEGGILRPGHLHSFAPKSVVPVFADVFRAAVARGIIVVLPAGNGLICQDNTGCPEVDWANDYGGNLDDSNVPDVGAIVVGAGAGADGTTADTTRSCFADIEGDPVRGRLSFSNYGARSVQVQGPGSCVATTDVDASGAATYSRYFSGTSSASAVVAGVAALVSSVYEARTGTPLTPELARKALIASGSPQAPTARPGAIGPLPHVTRAVDYLTTAPETTFTSGPAAGSRTNNPQPTFTFDSNWPSGVTFECSVGDLQSPWEPCTSPFKPSAAQPENAVIFRVRAKSPGGVDASPASRMVIFDYTAPQTQIDGGAAAGATVTGNPTYSFSAPAETLPTFECRLDLGAWTACTSPYTVRSGLTSGPHSFQVRAKDRAGNVDATPAARTMRVPDGRALTVGAAAPVAATVDLTGAPAAADWVHWKANGVWAVPDRANVATPRISGLEKYGSGAINLLNGATTYTWSNAQGTAAGSSKLGVGTGAANGRGYRFTVAPSTLDTRTLRVYVGAAGAASSGELRASFPGQPAVVSAPLATTSASYADRVYEITYRPGSSTDTLSVEWVQKTGGSAGRVILYAAQVL